MLLYSYIVPKLDLEDLLCFIDLHQAQQHLQYCRFTQQLQAQ